MVLYTLHVPSTYSYLLPYLDANMISELKCIFKLNEKFLVEVGWRLGVCSCGEPMEQYAKHLKYKFSLLLTIEHLRSQVSASLALFCFSRFVFTLCSLQCSYCMQILRRDKSLSAAKTFWQKISRKYVSTYHLSAPSRCRRYIFCVLQNFFRESLIRSRLFSVSFFFLRNIWPETNCNERANNKASEQQLVIRRS